MSKNLLITLFAALAIAFLPACGDDSPDNPTKPVNGFRPSYPHNITDAQKAVLDQLFQDMVTVEGGSFTMGATADQGSDITDHAKPAHKVSVDKFYICKYEVTEMLWAAVNNTSSASLLPKNNVSYTDVISFIRKLQNMTSINFRLPTEAEWEFAARGGKKSNGYRYAGSNNANDVAWYLSNSGMTTHAVGSLAPNELGLYDMSGNVWELCSDWYGDFTSASQTNPTGPASGTYRVQRGGDGRVGERGVRIAIRDGILPNQADQWTGFRLVIDKSIYLEIN